MFNWSDAWLLHAVATASGANPANLTAVVAAGDAINRALFTPAELHNGLYRLVHAGHLKISSDTVGLAGPVMAMWRDKWRQLPNVRLAQEEVERFLNVSTDVRPLEREVVDPAAWPTLEDMRRAEREYLDENRRSSDYF